MKRFFDFPPSLWAYFRDVDARFVSKAPPQGVTSPQPPPITPYVDNLPAIRAVLWDVYGTLFGTGVGDLERSLQYEDRLLTAAHAAVEEFLLAEPLQKLYPQQPPDAALRDRYLQLIAESHQHSLAQNIDYPEVLIECIWETILQECSATGYQSPWDEPTLHTAYRCAYFFDANLQSNYLFAGIVSCLFDLKNTGLLQGIISNAQFYTPIQLRRLLRVELKRDDFDLAEVFCEPLIFLSYELGCSKPNSHAFRRATDVLAENDIAPKQILYVGNDMLNDVFAARQVGFTAALFAADNHQTALRRDDPRCRDLRPHAVFTDASQIAPALLGNK